MLKEVIENGQNFEELSLLNTLLTEQSDARPLPKDAQHFDELLAKKEAILVEQLNNIEQKVDDNDAILEDLRSKKSYPKWRTQSEVSQHIYSSLSLQGVRIKRVRALLDSLASQLESSSFAQNERRVTNLGLSLSRLERLSLCATNSPLQPVRSASVSRRSLSSPLTSRTDKTLLSGQLVGRRSSPELKQRFGHTSRLKSTQYPINGKADIDTNIVRHESANVLRGLAMRKGRDKIE
eukprot:IDg19808t1